MINHGLKFVFIHQRKCAGTSVKRCLQSLFPVPECDLHFANEGTLCPDLSRYAALGYLIITSCRNPWDRLVSGWAHLQKPEFQSSPYNGKTFRDTVLNLPRPDSNCGVHAEGHDYRHLTRCQLDTLTLGSRFVPDVVLRFESLQQDFDKLLTKLSVSPLPLPCDNESSRTHYSNYYDEGLINLVSTHFSEDIEHFGYDFEGSIWKLQ